ncbi:MAG TPA: hypothetical protein VI072_19085 [Polyangiaceae bacterium]
MRFLRSYTRLRSAAARSSAALVSLWPAVAAAQPEPQSPQGTPAGAAAPRLRLAPGDCGGLDVSETERLLRTELAIVAARAERVRAPVVHVTCAQNQVTIRVRDTRSRRTIEETMPAPPEGQPGRERVFALAASQLFLSSWLDVVLSEERRPKAPPAVTRAPRAPRPRASPKPRTAGREFSPELALRAGARLRRVTEALPSAAGSLELGLGSTQIAIALHVAAERTRQTRSESGGVSFDLLGGGAGLELRYGRGFLGWAASARVAGYWVHADAEGQDATVRAASATGSAFEAALGGGPVLAIAPHWRLGFELGAGALLPQVVARVERGPDVSLHGAFAELTLKLRYHWKAGP